MKLSLLLVLLSALRLAAAETLYFSLTQAPRETRLKLVIDGKRVDGALETVDTDHDKTLHRGNLTGQVQPQGRLLTRLSLFFPEDRPEQPRLFLLQDGKLREAADPRAAEPAWGPVWKPATITSPRPGSPERKALMEAMRVPVSRHIGHRVRFTGEVRQSGSWAIFQGDAELDPQAPKPQQEIRSDELELDFAALLEKTPDGTWVVRHWGFAGDIGVLEEARKRFPLAPWALFL